MNISFAAGKTIRIICLSIGMLGLLYGPIFSARAQNQYPISRDEQGVLNTRDISHLEKEVSDQQIKIEELEVAMAVVKDDSEQNNKILWGLMTGTAMLVLERAVGFMSRKRDTGEDSDI